MDVQFHLNANYGTYEERDEQHYADGVDTQLRHVFGVLLEEHPHALGHREHTPHQDEVTSENCEIFFDKHKASNVNRLQK